MKAYLVLVLIVLVILELLWLFLPNNRPALLQDYSDTKAYWEQK